MAIRGFSGGGSQGGGRTRGFGGPSGPRRGGEPGDPGGPGGHGPRGPERRGYFSGVRLFHGPMRFMFFGRPIIISSGRQIGFMCGFVAFLVMLVSTFAVFGNLSMYKNDREEWRQTIAEYQEYSSSYLDIIQKANDGESGYGKTTGTFDRNSYSGSVNGQMTGFVIYNSYGSRTYSVVYRFTIDGDAWTYGETMSLYYSTSDVPSSLTIAYQIVTNGNEVIIYSVETDFVNTYAEDMAYYEAQVEACNSSIKTATTSAVILIVIIVVIIALIILSFVKVIKNSKKQQAMEEAKKQAEVKEAQARAQQAEDELNQSRRYCEYCGTKFPEGEDECPNCGSSHFIIKK